MGATELIANFIVDTGYDRIPTEAMSSAKGAIVDGLGCILAGSHEPSGSIIKEYVKELGGNPEASVIGGGFKTSVTQASLANGTMAHALDYDDDAVTWLGDPFDIVSSGVSMKPYPCCLLTHRCIDAILHLIKEYGVVANDVEKVECRTSEFIPQALIHARPRTALEGKFSMQYCMAIALLDGRIGFKQFTDEKVLDPKAQELLKRVTYVHPEGLIPLQSEAVTIKPKDGRELSHEVATPKGDPQNPMTKKELAVKYRECASFVLSPQDTQKSLEMISYLEDIEDITELMNLVR